MEPVRLQKILAHAGFGSRRACEKFISEGRVLVDGVVVRELGSKADPETQTIEFDGQKVAGPGRMSKSVRESADKVYYLLNKPRGVLCTNEDPSGRMLAVQLIPEKRRIYCVGRLDQDTEGLLILTNDGELTNQLTHPRYGVSKTYIAKVTGEVSLNQIRKLEQGVHLAEGKTQGMQVRVRKRSRHGSVMEITIAEGMNRQVRRALARVNLRCQSLKRIAAGPLRLGELPTGAYRELTSSELSQLRSALAKAQAASVEKRDSDFKGRPAGEQKDLERKPEHSESKPERPAFKPAEHWKPKKEEPRRHFHPQYQNESRPFRPKGKTEGHPSRPWEKREGHPARPFEKREGKSRPWEKREGHPARPFEKREGKSRPWEKREGHPTRPWEKRNPKRREFDSEGRGFRPWEKHGQHKQGGGAGFKGRGKDRRGGSEH